MKEGFIMKKTWKMIMLLISVTILATGCGEKKEEESATGQETAVEESQDGEVTMETVDLDFVSNDGRIALTLPNETWICTEDTEDNIVITSEEGVINIIRNEGEAVASQLVDNQEAYESMIRGIFFGIEFDVLSFEQIDADGRRGYQAVIQYAQDNPDRYMVGAATYGETDGYTVAATLYKDDAELLSIVENSVFSMKVSQ